MAGMLKPSAKDQALPEVHPGDIVRVHQKIKEGGKERIQVFEGLVIAVKHGMGLNGTFTVRKIGANNIAVEKIFPIHSPNIIKIERIKTADVRRSKIYYMRDRFGKAAKLKRESASLTIWEEKDAEKENIKANEEAINTQLAQSKSQFADEDTFAKELTAQGFTKSTFRKFLTLNNIIQQYLAVHIDISSATASQEEVTALYNQAAAGNANIPPLAEIRTQVENQIVQTKQQQLVTKFIEQLKASSVIETLI